MINFDAEKITQAILACDSSPVAKEAAAPLIDAWIQEFGEKDNEHETLLVESPFYIWLDPMALIVGVLDRVARIPNSITYGCEWKTTREPSKYWTSEKWFDELVRSPQLSIYGLGLNRGTFVGSKKFNVEPPINLFVRAAVKTGIPTFWPDHRPNFVAITQEALEATENALHQRVAAIRQARKLHRLPWQLTGMQCTKFNQECEFFKRFCEHHQHPLVDQFIDKDDPGMRAIEMTGESYSRLDHPYFVVLSASSYQLTTECMEKYRLVSGMLGKEDSLAIQIGAAFHKGIGAFYEQFLLGGNNGDD